MRIIIIFIISSIQLMPGAWELTLSNLLKLHIYKIRLIVKFLLETRKHLTFVYSQLCLLI